MKKIKDSIPADLLALYMARKVSSEAVALATGFHAAAIRRAIERAPVEPEVKSNTLLKARRAFRMTLGNLPPKEIQKVANVSISTAHRIRKAYKLKEASNARRT